METGEAALVPPGTTVVTFTLADTKKTQMLMAPVFARYGMHATFYVNSPRIGRSSAYLTLEDLRALAAAGHEIAGHTLDHDRLDTMPEAEIRRQVCDDRANLMSLGFPVSSFAYPSSSDTPTARRVVIECNFNNARATGGIKNPYGCPTCPPAETIPPRDMFLIRTPPSVKSDWTLADLQSLVLQAEAAGGGYIQVSLHDICDGCGTYSTKLSVLEAFVDWLALRASQGTVVMTAHELMGGEVKPPLYSDGGTFPFDAGAPDAGAPDAGAPDAGEPDAGAPDAGPGEMNLLRNPSLETDSDTNNVPDCWKRVNTGTTSGGWSRTTDAHTGSWAQTARISSLTTDSDRRLEVLRDTGVCAPAVTPGNTYHVSAWYKTSGRAGFVAAYRTDSGWVPWTSGPDLPPSSTYQPAEWTTPPVPAGALNISIGLALRSATTLTMDDFTLVEVSPSPPSASLRVVTPNNRQMLTAGSTYDVQWDSTGPWSTMNLAYSTDLGATWKIIAAGAPNTGRYTWPVPANTTERGLLRISSTDAPFLWDTSDAPFTIAPAASGTALPDLFFELELDVTHSGSAP